MHVKDTTNCWGKAQLRWSSTYEKKLKRNQTSCYRLSGGSTCNMPVPNRLLLSPKQEDDTTSVSVYIKWEKYQEPPRWTGKENKRLTSRSAKWSKFMDMVTSIPHFSQVLLLFTPNQVGFVKSNIQRVEKIMHKVSFWQFTCPQNDPSRVFEPHHSPLIYFYCFLSLSALKAPSFILPSCSPTNVMAIPEVCDNLCEMFHVD